MRRLTIELSNDAIKLCPMSSPSRDISLNGLAAALRLRFGVEKDPQILDRAMALSNEALELCPRPHSRRVTVLNGFAEGLVRRFSIQGHLDDLDQALLIKEVVELSLDPSSRESLALILKLGSERVVAREDLEHAIELFQELVGSNNAPDPELV